MKLLFDQNISPNLVALLADVFPGSLHVRQAGLERSDDELVWRFALERGFAIATKDRISRNAAKSQARRPTSSGFDAATAPLGISKRC